MHPSPVAVPEFMDSAGSASQTKAQLQHLEWATRGLRFPVDLAAVPQPTSGRPAEDDEACQAVPADPD